MSAKLVGKALDVTGVTASEKLVLVALADRSNKDTGRCNPSLAKVAEQVPNRDGSGPISVRQVRNLIRRLESKRLLRTIPRSGTSNSYIVLPEVGTAVPGWPRNWVSRGISGGPEVQSSGPPETQTSAEPEGTAKQPLAVDTLPHHLCRSTYTVIEVPKSECPTNCVPKHQLEEENRDAIPAHAQR